DDDLLAHCRTMLFIFEPREFLEKLLKSDIRVHDNRFHLCEVLEVWIQIDGVEDTKSFLPDLGALAGRAAKHLFVEDAAVYTAQEDKVLNARNVDACG